MVLFIIELFAEVKYLGFYIKPSSEYLNGMLCLPNFIQIKLK